MTDTPPEDHPKVSHWDRPKPPHDWRWVVGGVGRTLITLGLLMFGFVAYQLWGTGIQTAQAQRELSADFDKLVGGTGTTTTTVGVSVSSTTTSTVPATTTPAGTIAPTTTTTTSLPGPAAGKPLPAEGEAIARLEIPRIGLNRIVVEGATTDDLAKGQGHFPETPLPGQLGNAAIAGHRTTHLHPFYDIDKLQPGDEIIVTTLNGRYVYHVTGTEVVSPDDYADVIPTTDATKATLTRVSCTPRYSSSHRIIVRSDLVAGESDALTASAAIAATGQNLPGETLPSEGAVTTVAAVTTVTTADTVSATVSATDPSVTT
ncbi:MAG: class E sortase, partial [Ilumatobacteraceae bacterium]